MEQEINDLAKLIYEQNKAVGWWDDPDRCKLQTLQLVSTEIAEATEGERKNLMDEHLPHRKMGEVELADALIRILDMGGAYGWKYLEGFAKEAEEGLTDTLEVAESIGAKHALINIGISGLAVCLFDELVEEPDFTSKEELNELYTAIIWSIIKVSDMQGYCVQEAMYEKLEYNKTRADHKRENRQKENGKAF